LVGQVTFVSSDLTSPKKTTGLIFGTDCILTQGRKEIQEGNNFSLENSTKKAVKNKKLPGKEQSLVSDWPLDNFLSRPPKGKKEHYLRLQFGSHQGQFFSSAVRFLEKVRLRPSVGIEHLTPPLALLGETRL